MTAVYRCGQRLVFAVEDKVWESEEGAGVFGIVAALDTGFGAAAVIGERFFFVAAESAQNRAQARTAAEEASGFVGGELQRIFFVDIDAADFGELDELALDHFLGEVDQNIQNAEIAFFERHLKRL